MKLTEYLSFFSSTLYAKADKYGYIQLIDDYDNTIYAIIPAHNQTTTEISDDVIPYYYVTGQIDFLINDDLHNHYGASDEQIAQFEGCTFSEIADIAKKIGLDAVYKTYKEVCTATKGIGLIEIDDELKLKSIKKPFMYLDGEKYYLNIGEIYSYIIDAYNIGRLTPDEVEKCIDKIISLISALHCDSCVIEGPPEEYYTIAVTDYISENGLYDFLDENDETRIFAYC